MPKILYRSDDDGTMYTEQDIDDIDPVTKEARGFSRWELADVITLTPDQCVSHYGDLLEILIAAKYAKRV